MTNPFDVAAALKRVYDATKELDLKTVIVDVRSQYLELQEENLALRTELANLKRRAELRFDGRIYVEEKGGVVVSRYCQRCHDVDGKLVRLQPRGNNAWTCRQCGQYTEYGDNRVTAPTPVF